MAEANTNVELVDNGFAAFAEQGVEALIPLIAEDFVPVTPPSLASEPDTYGGEEAFAAAAA